MTTVTATTAENTVTGAEIVDGMLTLTKGDATTDDVPGIASVYVYDGTDSYDLAGGRIFIGSVDPETTGVTLVDGDMWEDTSA